MRAVVLVPYRESKGRDTNWLFVQQWITRYGERMVVSDCDGEFSRAKARNNAAALAGDWDVAVFHDADTIAHPDAVTLAIDLAARTNKLVVAGDSHMYCCPTSSERIKATGKPEFARPNTFDEHGIYEKPCSGVFAVSRQLWESTGGYVELSGWGYEDLVFLQQCGIFGSGNTWIPGHITLHLWHPPSERDSDTATNMNVWRKLTGYRRHNDASGARTYLASLGHTVP